MVTAIGMILLLALVRQHSGVWTWIPGLLLFGIGIGTMLTSSVNVVQSSFPDSDQGEISGLSRSVSNLGSSLGTAITGTILAAGVTHAYAIAMSSLAVIALVGLAAALRLPAEITPATQRA